MKLSLIGALAGALTLHVGAMAQTAGATPDAASTPAAAVSSAPDEYRLGVSDKVRILVFNEPTLSGEFSVNSNGSIALPLIGDVAASGKTTSDVTREIQTRLSDGYLRDPRVSIDVVNFRPFFILGEVNKPGEYPYSTGLTVQNAVATAQGFTYRAEKRRAFVKHAGENSERSLPLTSGLAVNPGDTIRIGERYF